MISTWLVQGGPWVISGLALLIALRAKRQRATFDDEQGSSAYTAATFLAEFASQEKPVPHAYYAALKYQLDSTRESSPYVLHKALLAALQGKRLWWRTKDGWKLICMEGGEQLTADSTLERALAISGVTILAERPADAPLTGHE